MHEIHRQVRRSAAALIVAVLLAAGPASANGDGGNSIGQALGSAGEAVFDVVILRPLGLVATAGGFGAFLVTAPLLAPSQEIPYGWDTFVMGPYEYTIERPLGDF